jgi:hypothetical protein
MSKMSGEKASQLAINLIEEQLQVLPIAIAMIWQSADVGNVEEGLLAEVLKRKPRLPKTGSAGNIAASYAAVDPKWDFHASTRALHSDPLQKNRYLRVVISNVLLTVGAYFKENNMAEMRTPEVQFLGHVYKAILNENTFDLEEGYLPIATFDGLVIDSRLNQTPLFGDGTAEGFMEFGDAIALLQWLSRFLRGEKNFVSGGDAG